MSIQGIPENAMAHHEFTECNRTLITWRNWITYIHPTHQQSFSLHDPHHNVPEYRSSCRGQIRNGQAWFLRGFTSPETWPDPDDLNTDAPPKLKCKAEIAWRSPVTSQSTHPVPRHVAIESHSAQNRTTLQDQTKPPSHPMDRHALLFFKKTERKKERRSAHGP